MNPLTRLAAGDSSLQYSSTTTNSWKFEDKGNQYVERLNAWPKTWLMALNSVEQKFYFPREGPISNNLI